MEIQVKGILKKLSVTDDKVNVGRLEIANNKITEIKYQMATAWTQGFITFCTEKGGQKVKNLNDATLNKNSICFIMAAMKRLKKF
ncbi:hypothetical protein Z962_05650 [Clostridium botulinum C/D str. BKT12695]|nr:hypothetical protein Z962_05650 [Clostridium botulinum C/D str. BKT12695]